jgi:D-amino-acid oxidase
MTDVIVVGGGIIGLTAGVRLAEAGAAVRLWSPVEPGETVSAVAAAVWYPSRIAPDPRLVAWSRTAYDEFTRQAAEGVPGVRLLPTVNIERRQPWWAPATGGVEIRFVAPAVEMEIYLPWLQDRFRAAGGIVERRDVRSLDEADAPAVVNATGLAAAALCGDDAVYPVRGQVVLVANPGLTTSYRDEENATYVHPRTHDVVLGGSFEPGVRDVTPDPALRRDIVARCVALVPELAGAPIVGEKVGLRPARHGGPRLERTGRIVHCYGHGGAGMTLSWGCAADILELIRPMLDRPVVRPRAQTGSGSGAPSGTLPGSSGPGNGSTGAGGNVSGVSGDSSPGSSGTGSLGSIGG